jgi:hypothetical protein
MSKCRKVRYYTRLDAKIALASTRSAAAAGDRNEIRIYWCKGCSALHLTSQKKRLR